QYLMDVNIVPTASVDFPNLQVLNVVPPTSPTIHSGNTTTLDFTVQNAGSQATGAAGWADRVVLSTNTIYGDADDILVGIFTHTGALSPSQAYHALIPAQLPNGI